MFIQSSEITLVLSGDFVTVFTIAEFNDFCQVAFLFLP
jgi:hypothetical protein